MFSDVRISRLLYLLSTGPLILGHLIAMEWHNRLAAHMVCTRQRLSALALVI